MNQVSWQEVCPLYNDFSDLLDTASTLPPIEPIELQPRLKAALSYFVSDNCPSKVLVIKDGDSLAYRQLVSDSIEKLGHSTIIGVEANPDLLLDRYKNVQGENQISRGLVSQANKGVLVCSAQSALANLGVWTNLKSLLQGAKLECLAVDSENVSVQPPTFSSDFKLVIIGDREQLSDLDLIDSDYRSGFMQYTEVESDLKVTQTSAEQYLSFVNYVVRTCLGEKQLDRSAYLKLLQAGARETEDKQYWPLSLDWHKALLCEASSYSHTSVISCEHIESAIDAKRNRESYLPERAIDDILEGQVVIETQGKQVGQVNGLTVIDIPGHPISYGEPARISCVVHFGDGDISDVERKVDLGGNIHAKGMMIMQAFVSSELDLDAPLPYSASIVFEQSYCEVDGDSASLAELCSLVSALSGYPIDQQIAVTGAVDQFGRVQAVGGLNEKVEGFYNVCKHQGLTGKQGVILPKTNVQHLALNKELVESIKNGEFHIWSATHVDEVIPLLLGKPFNSESEESVIGKIAERIENFEKHEMPESIVTRIKNWFV
ncbi:S16 family serine protease [Vibrio maritimus]|uniref:S16 family serine protease n=1 Tax=Vibrio maritimus TaxID=990268 RepID=UPI001F2D2966|nr:Lon protease family protein [Vibrio maritimus]